MLNKIPSKVYIDPQVFEWPCFSQGGSYGDESRIRRSYETLEHVTNLIGRAPDEFGAADAIINLKRAINIRLKLLNETYRFSEVARLKKVGVLERLELVGLAKPFLIRQLFELRNDIEHNDASPPPLSRVRELLDIAWYFLRSTDPAVNIHLEGLEFSAPDAVDDSLNLWLEAEVVSAKKSHQVAIRGWLAPPFLTYRDGWEVSVKRMTSPPNSVSENGARYFEEHGSRHPEERYILGQLDGNEDALIQFWKRSFSAA